MNTKNPPPGLFTQVPIVDPVVKGVAKTLQKVPYVGELFAGMFYGLA
jgi:hypothetical protein